MESRSEVKTTASKVKYVDRGPKWGAKRGYRWPGSGRQQRTPTHGTPFQLARQFQAFEFHIRSFTHKEIARLLNCEERTVSIDIGYEYERRRAHFEQTRTAWVERTFHMLEALKQANWEVVTKQGGLSATGHEYKSIIAATALQARIMGYEAPRTPQRVSVEGTIDHHAVGLPELPRQLPEEFATQLLYLIAEGAGMRGDPRLEPGSGGGGPIALGPDPRALKYVGPVSEVYSGAVDAGAVIDVGPDATGQSAPADAG